jgi:hypothetical protein
VTAPMTDFESYAEKVRAALAERRALAQAATAGPWGCDETSGVNDLHWGWVAKPLLTGPNTYGPSVEDTRFIAANDPAHVLALLDQQETAVGVAVEGLRRHHPRWGTPTWMVCSCGRPDSPDPCSDALAWWSVLTGIGATYGVERTNDAPSRRHSTARTGDRGLSGTRVTPEGGTGLTEPQGGQERL